MPSTPGCDDSAHDDGGVAFGIEVDRPLRFGERVGFDKLAVAVLLVEIVGQLACAGGIVGQEQIERRLRRPEATRRVEPRAELKTDRRRRERLAQARAFDESGEPNPARATACGRARG